MTFKAVTTAQMEQVRKMAREKRVSRDEFQVILDNGSVASMLNGAKTSELVAESVQEPSAPSLLTELATIDLPPVERFVAADAFGENNPDGIKFYLGDNFRQNFLGNVEENVPAATLATHRLNRNSLDGPIRQALGAANEETGLAHAYELIRRQPQGQAGDLPVDGTWVIGVPRE